MGRKVISPILDQVGRFNPVNLINPFNFGGAPYDPASLTGLKAWLKADALVLSNNDPVSTWTDSSGNGNDGTASSTARPLYKTGILNGKPVVRFDGSDDAIFIPNIPSIVSSSYFSIFMAITVPSGQCAWLSHGTFNSFTDDILIAEYSGQRTYQVDDGVEGLASGGSGAAETLITSILFDGTQGSDATRLRVFENTTQKTLSFGAYTVPSATSANAGQWNLGAYISYPPGFYLNGDVAELAISSAAVGSTEWLQYATYLGNKYGVF